MKKNWFLILVFTMIMAPVAARADVSLLVLESIGVSGEFTGGGHAAVYLSNICSDDAIHLRPCGVGEEGVVISSYPHFVNGTTYKWMAVPLTAYLYGVTKMKNVPIYANGKVRDFLREAYRRDHMNGIVPRSPDGTVPAGGWRLMLTAAFNRDVYGITVQTSAEEDAVFLRQFSSEPNQGNFSVFTNNCADFARKTINKYFPGAVHRDWLNDFGITTPKSDMRSLLKYAEKSPSRLMYMSRFSQIPGPIWRSSDNRNFSEMAVRSKKYLIPALIFDPPVAAIFAATYLLTGRFDIHKSYAKYPNAEVARLRRQKEFRNDLRIMNFVDRDPVTSVKDRIRQETNAVLGDQQTWNAYRAAFVPILNNAVEKGLFKDAKEVETFFRDLELQSEPALDENGLLVLKVRYYGGERILGITRYNLLAPGSDKELALKLTLARLNADLNADEKNRCSLQDLMSDWRVVRQLTTGESPIFANIDRTRGRFVTSPPKESAKSKIKKLVIAITH